MLTVADGEQHDFVKWGLPDRSRPANVLFEKQISEAEGVMHMTVKPIPDGFHTVVPNMIVKNVDEAVEFYQRVFGAEEILRLTMPDGKVAHCELKFGDSRVNLGEAMEGWPEHNLLAQIYVEDSDAVFDRAVELGAQVVTPMADMFFGSREGRISDPFGNTWTIATQKENVSSEEMQRRLNALTA